MTLGYVNPASAAPPPGGFLLTQTDAAYVDWGPDAQDGCTGVSIFVGFVEGTLQLPRGSRPNPDHADIQVFLDFDCGDGPVHLEGLAQAADCTTTMDKLVSASVTCLFYLDGDVGMITIAGLAWAEIERERVSVSHESNERFRLLGVDRRSDPIDPQHEELVPPGREDQSSTKGHERRNLELFDFERRADTLASLDPDGR